MKKKIKLEYVTLFLILYLEIIFKLIIIKNCSTSGILYTLLFSTLITFIINLVCNLFNEKISKIIFTIISVIIILCFLIQSIFFRLFSVPFSFMTIGLAGNALHFTDIIFDAIKQNIFLIFIMFLPIILYIIILKKIETQRYNGEKVGINVGIIFVIFFVIVGSININKTETYSAYNLLFNINAQEKNIEKFGLLTSTVIDIQRTIFGFEEKVVIETGSNELEEQKSEQDENQTEEEQPEEVVTYNEMDLQLENLIQQTTDKSLKNVYEYINNVEPSKKNEYTGYFKDKNLIFILAEGFNSISVSQELTPTLYKLANSGFVFNNFYSPVFLSTTGGEFQATTGLIPTQDILKMWKNNNPYMGNSIGNSFSKVGYKANAYHDWTYTYYSRHNTMKTLGFESYLGVGNGLEKLMASKWLPSDIDMMNVTTDFYTSEDKFVTYYVTVSGHAPYNFSGGNSIASKNKDLVADLSYDTAVKAYIASQIELDRAIETLINRLDEKGILQNTVIALVGDHYPYTLTIDEVNSISSYTRDDIVEVNKSNFILWNSQMEDAIQIDKVGSQIDVLPTLLNLFGIEYDSRTIIGQDILSDTPGIAIFSNRSWTTDLGTYFSTKKTFVPKENAVIEDGYVNSINKSVANKFIMSNLFVKYDIYKNLLGD